MGRMLRAGLILVLALLGVTVTGLVALVLWSLPGLRLLPKTRRVAPDGIMTIAGAIAACQRSGMSGWMLVGYAQQIAAHRFSYSRRNPWDTPARAFARGMGYCQQQTLALGRIYAALGIDAQPVYALQCRFPVATIHGLPEPERISPHTWLRVRIGDEVRDVCCGSRSNTPGIVHFTALSEVKPLTPWLRPFSHLGSVIENIRRDRRARQEGGAVQNAARNA
jgi:hypothetical protein